MKTTIHRPDGTKIETDGSAEEVSRLLQAVPVPQTNAWFVPTVHVTYCPKCLQYHAPVAQCWGQNYFRWNF